MTVANFRERCRYGKRTPRHVTSLSPRAAWGDQRQWIFVWFVSIYIMTFRYCPPFAGMLIVTFLTSIQPFVQADTFGSGTNSFAINFVQISNTNNGADTTGYGAVPYEYRMGVNEISQEAITKATASGMTNVTAGAWTGSRPAANISWYEAAAFVNWLNTSSGYQAAYNLSFSSSWTMTLWSSSNAWQSGGENLFRHKDAYYFLPSENEWYKAAYYNPAGSNYFLYQTASSTAPTAVASGTNASSAVYGQAFAQGPASVEAAGGLSTYGTMGQGGNVWEWTETAYDGTNSSSTENREVRGGTWSDAELQLRSTTSNFGAPSLELSYIGFRVASIPEPSTYTLLALSAAGLGSYLWRRKRK